MQPCSKLQQAVQYCKEVMPEVNFSAAHLRTNIPPAVYTAATNERRSLHNRLACACVGMGACVHNSSWCSTGIPALRAAGDEKSEGAEALQLYNTTHQAPLTALHDITHGKGEAKASCSVLRLGTLRIALTCIIGFGREDGRWLYSLCSRAFRHSPVTCHVAGVSLQCIIQERGLTQHTEDCIATYA